MKKVILSGFTACCILLSGNILAQDVRREERKETREEEQRERKEREEERKEHREAEKEHRKEEWK
ncbi:MAG: hypothetical protein LUD02_02255 [Tannerellaceae bacterium]|nr:hypothetical protein [Tannerellaceae bacterium]